MNSDATHPVVKRGTFLYDGSVPCGIRIVQTDFSPGSGDYEDEPEARDDKFGIFYEVQMQSAGGDGRYSTGIPGFESLEAAVRHVESVAPGVLWE